MHLTLPLVSHCDRNSESTFSSCRDRDRGGGRGRGKGFSTSLPTFFNIGDPYIDSSRVLKHRVVEMFHCENDGFPRLFGIFRRVTRPFSYNGSRG
jgi:hypothetical protein